MKYLGFIWIYWLVIDEFIFPFDFICSWDLSQSQLPPRRSSVLPLTQVGPSVMAVQWSTSQRVDYLRPQKMCCFPIQSIFLNSFLSETSIRSTGFFQQECRKKTKDLQAYPPCNHHKPIINHHLPAIYHHEPTSQWGNPNVIIPHGKQYCIVESTLLYPIYVHVCKDFVPWVLTSIAQRIL